MAKTYLEVNPSANILILEAASSIGGVWAEDRLYPELKSNNLLGTYEFSDFPMDPEIFGVNPGEHIPAEVMHNYLTYYAERFDLISRIRFETKVNSAEYKGPGKWLIKVTRGFIDDNALESDEISTKRLVVATGLTSEPFLPTFTGGEVFGAPLFHSRDFLKYESTLETAKKVAVFGGSKSAWDAVYAYASKGVQVDWIIRGEDANPLGHNNNIV
jgi:cation diffusion facilitator CzcD-associated flavoprotein CzcO